MRSEKHMALVAGGARSGKSAFALRWAMTAGDQRLFVATAQALDEEMGERIERHRVERGDEFRTLEAPLQLEDALAASHAVDVVVIDCLTLFVSNLLLAGQSDEAIVSRMEAIGEQLSRAPFSTIVVSNEVGMGIVPENALSRRFRDLTGRAHQLLAQRCDELYFATMGTILRLRPAPVEVCTL